MPSVLEKTPLDLSLRGKGRDVLDGIREPSARIQAVMVDRKCCVSAKLALMEIASMVEHRLAAITNNQ